jgi:hypothetical protein
VAEVLRRAADVIRNGRTDADIIDI